MKNYKSLLLGFLAILGTNNLHAQTVLSDGNKVIRCATMEVDAALRAANPDLGTLDDFEIWMAEKIQETQSQRSSVIYTIPVVFHIIHDGENEGTGSNISGAQVQSQIDILNEDFRKMMGTNGHNTNPVGADTEIEFCPAIIDPSGNIMVEPGIDRVNRNSKGFSSPPYGSTNYIDNTIKTNTFWNPDNYYNIWVLDLGGGLLGYAQFPNGSGLPGMGNNNGGASTDGIVIGHEFTGAPPYNTFGGPFNYGRTATHEIGHAFGLRHIWGDGGCGVDDYCADTPLSDASNFGCPNTSSCGTTDMVENYMDYTNDLCMNIFTQDQKTRMRTVLMNSPRRASLLNSTVCGSPSAPVANFGTGNKNPCQGDLVQFIDSSLHNPTGWAWYFGGGANVDSAFVQNPIVSFDSVGTFAITLVVTNGLGSDTIVKTSYITVVDRLNLDFGSIVISNENCGGANDGSIMVTASGGASPLQYSINGGLIQSNGNFTNLGAGTYMVHIVDANGCSLDSSGLVVSGFSNPDMATSSLVATTCSDACDGGITVQVNSGGMAPFNYTIDGITMQPTGVFQNLCGGSYNVRVIDANGCKDSIQLSVFSPSAIVSNVSSLPDNGTDNGQIYFAPTGGFGPYSYTIDGVAAAMTNNGLAAGTYITEVIDVNGCVKTDTVVVASNVSIEEILLQQVQVYPIPSSGILNLQLPAKLKVDRVEIFSIIGQVNLNLELTDDNQLDISSLADGVYYIRIESNKHHRTLAVVKQ